MESIHHVPPGRFTSPFDSKTTTIVKRTVSTAIRFHKLCDLKFYCFPLLFLVNNFIALVFILYSMKHVMCKN